jgi:hypothetical protein
MSVADITSLVAAMTELKQHWLHALTTAAGAVDAAAAAHALPADEGRAHRKHLTVERTWVETMDWPSLAPAT